MVSFSVSILMPQVALPYYKQWPVYTKGSLDTEILHSSSKYLLYTPEALKKLSVSPRGYIVFKMIAHGFWYWHSIYIHLPSTAVAARVITQLLIYTASRHNGSNGPVWFSTVCHGLMQQTHILFVYVQPIAPVLFRWECKPAVCPIFRIAEIHLLPQQNGAKKYTVQIIFLVPFQTLLSWTGSHGRNATQVHNSLSWGTGWFQSVNYMYQQVSTFISQSLVL